MADQSHSPVATPEQRTAAIELVLRRHGALQDGFVEDFTDHADDAWVTANGAKMVARAWTDPDYRARMLADGTSAAREMGFDFPEHHRHLVVLENKPDVHNVIVCTLCSCTAYTIIGAAPGWYKDLDYRARVVRESRTVLREILAGSEIDPASSSPAQPRWDDNDAVACAQPAHACHRRSRREGRCVSKFGAERGQTPMPEHTPSCVTLLH